MPESSQAPGQQAPLPDPQEPVPAGSASQVCGYRGVTAMHATGITYRQLDYWARTGLVAPSIRAATGSGSHRLYSFRDLVVLRVVKSLLEAGVSLQNIRRAIETLRAYGAEDLASITLISDGTTVYACRSSEEVVDLLQGGQGVFGIAIGGACQELEGTLSHLPADPGVAPPESPSAPLSPPEVPDEAPVEADAGWRSAPVSDELAARRTRRRAS